MKIAPIDIAHKSFKKRAFGLDADEVSEFLKAVADELEAVIRERNQLKEQLREKDLSILDYRERDKTLRETIVTAQRMAEKIREDAERESKLIVNDANQKAEMIVRDARDSLKRVYQEITDIKRAKLQFENSFKALLQSHMTMLDTSDKSAFLNTSLPNITESKDTQTRTNTLISPLSSGN